MIIVRVEWYVFESLNNSSSLLAVAGARSVSSCRSRIISKAEKGKLELVDHHDANVAQLSYNRFEHKLKETMKSYRGLVA